MPFPSRIHLFGSVHFLFQLKELGVGQMEGSALRDRVWIRGGSVWSLELDLVILMGPFQLGIFYDLQEVERKKKN